jgi:hypothetical protein
MPKSEIEGRHDARSGHDNVFPEQVGSGGEYFLWLARPAQ